MTETLINLGEEHGLVDAGGVFKGDELHGITGLGADGLSSDEPAGDGDILAHVFMEVLGLYVAQAF